MDVAKNTGKTRPGPGSIEFRGIHKAFGKHTILRDFSLTIPPRQSLVILGQSGVGKSVLLKCLLGFLPVDKGEIFIEGVCVHNETELQREERFQRSGVLFQASALLDTLTVWENIAFRLCQKFPLKEAKKRAMDSLAMVGLSPKTAHLYPDELSGGMRRRVSLARALSEKPTFLFFDEPTSGLDPIFSTMMGKLIRECTQKLKATAITITHDIRCAQIIADQIALLHMGKIAWQGPAQDVLTCTDPLVHQFVHGELQGPLASCL